MREKLRFLGLDVHAETIAVAICGNDDFLHPGHELISMHSPTV
jgi:hypothetical protein